MVQNLNRFPTNVCSGLCWFQDEISYHYLIFFLPVSLNLGKSAAKGVTFMFCRIWKWKQYMKNTTDGVNGFILSFNFVCPTKCVPSLFFKVHLLPVWYWDFADVYGTAAEVGENCCPVRILVQIILQFITFLIVSVIKPRYKLTRRS